MTNDEAFAVLRAIVADLGLKLEAPLTLDADLKRDLGIDSIDLLDVLFELNERCAIALTVEDLLARHEPSRVATLVASIAEAVSARGTGAETPRDRGADAVGAASGDEAEG